MTVLLPEFYDDIVGEFRCGRAFLEPEVFESEWKSSCDYDKVEENAKEMIKYMISSKEALNAVIKYFRRAKFLRIDSRNLIVFAKPSEASEKDPYNVHIFHQHTELKLFIWRTMKQDSHFDIVYHHLSWYKSVVDPHPADLFLLKSTHHHLHIPLYELLHEDNHGVFPEVKNFVGSFSYSFDTVIEQSEELARFLSNSFPNLETLKIVFDLRKDNQVRCEQFTMFEKLNKFHPSLFGIIPSNVKGSFIFNKETYFDPPSESVSEWFFQNLECFPTISCATENRNRFYKNFQIHDGLFFEGQIRFSDYHHQEEDICITGIETSIFQDINDDPTLNEEVNGIQFEATENDALSPKSCIEEEKTEDGRDKVVMAFFKNMKKTKKLLKSLRESLAPDEESEYYFV